MTAPTIARVGLNLFGIHWPRPMAVALRVSERTVRYWQAGERSPPKGVMLALAGQMRGKAVDLVKLADEIENQS